MVMKSLWVSLMILAFGMAPALAQDQDAAAQAMVAEMQAQLKLTPDQVSAVTPIIESYVSKQQELKDGFGAGSVDRAPILSRMKQLRKDEKQELSQVLSARQLNGWEVMTRKAWRRHEP